MKGFYFENLKFYNSKRHQLLNRLIRRTERYLLNTQIASEIENIEREK